MNIKPVYHTKPPGAYSLKKTLQVTPLQLVDMRYSGQASENFIQGILPFAAISSFGSGCLAQASPSCRN